MKKEIRTAVEADLDFIYQALKKDFADQGILKNFKSTKKSLRAALFGAAPIATVLLALVEGEPIGFANYSIDYRGFTYFGTPTLYLHDLFVEQAFRRLGIASLFFKALKKIAKKAKCGWISWVVMNDNKHALKFYKTLPKTKEVTIAKFMFMDLT